MQQNGDNKSSDRSLQIIVMILAVATVAFHLTLAASGRGLSRDQHLGTAVQYAKTRIDLLHPMILGANANGAPTPVEFPIWQAATAALMKLFGPWYGWGNVVSLLFHFSALWPLFHLAAQMFSRRTAWWAAVFYLAQPLAFVWGGMASTDCMSAVFSIWFVFLCHRMLSTGRWSWWPAAAIVGGLSATTKAPFFFTAGLTTFFWLLCAHRRQRTAWLQLFTTGLAAMAAFVLWSSHANSCYAMAEFPYSELRLARNKHIVEWWFGDWGIRFSVVTWVRTSWRASTVLLGSIGGVLLLMAGWVLQGSTMLKLWMGAAFCTVLVFTTVIVSHWHYFYIFSAPVVLLAARAAVEFEPALWRIFSSGICSRVAVCLVPLAFSLVQGMKSAHLNLLLDPALAADGRTLKEHTAPADKLVLWNSDWTGPLLRAERQGVSTLDFDVITDPDKLSRLKKLGYNKLVLLNTSPLLAAVSATGTGDYKDKHLPSEVPATARNWKVVFESPSVLILEIPQ